MSLYNTILELGANMNIENTENKDNRNNQDEQDPLFNFLSKEDIHTLFGEENEKLHKFENEADIFKIKRREYTPKKEPKMPDKQQKLENSEKKLNELLAKRTCVILDDDDDQTQIKETNKNINNNLEKKKELLEDCKNNNLTKDYILSNNNLNFGPKFNNFYNPRSTFNNGHNKNNYLKGIAENANRNYKRLRSYNPIENKMIENDLKFEADSNIINSNNISNKNFKSYMKGYNHLPSSGNFSTDECIICLTDIKNKSKINSCSHCFCFKCIKSWSQHCNKCPLCKKEFKVIITWNSEKKKYIENHIKKKNYKIEENDEFYFEDEYENISEICMICNKGNDEENLLICDKCNYNVCHTKCADLDKIPEEEWFCFECACNGDDIENYLKNNINNFFVDDEEYKDDFSNDEEKEEKNKRKELRDNSIDDFIVPDEEVTEGDYYYNDHNDFENENVCDYKFDNDPFGYNNKRNLRERRENKKSERTKNNKDQCHKRR